jgi:hypothetical protein
VTGARGPVSLAVGAWASTVPSVDVVVSHRTGRRLGLGTANAAVVSTQPSRSVEETRAVLKEVVDDVATVRVLGASTTTRQAYLMGGELADLVGSFSYQPLADGSISPDPAWVAQNIRTEAVPILGNVTCHRVMLPQLRGALADVERAGLASAIDRSDYGGCYVPRFIGSDPTRGLSLHSWGIALDLNVQGNLRGTVGEIDRRVVRIFKAWGFAWGGDWQWTDPMHFELAWIPR